MGLNFETPVCDRLLAEQLSDHLLDFVHLLFWLDAGLGQSVAHFAGIAHGSRDTVSQTEFGRQVKDGASILDSEKRLIGMVDVQLVVVLEVGDHRDLFTLVVKSLTGRVLSPDDLVDVVGALVAPIGNDRATSELGLNSKLELRVLLILLLELDNAIEASFSGHELEDGIHDQGTSHLALES